MLWLTGVGRRGAASLHLQVLVDKKKHYIHHLLVIFKKNGDKDNSEPGWCDYAAE
jgi:hypothetical protein